MTAAEHDAQKRLVLASLLACPERPKAKPVCPAPDTRA